MHIIHVHETNWIDRNVIQVHHLIERMVSRGHTCEVIDYDMLWPTRKYRKVWQPKQVFNNVNKIVPGVSLRVTRPGSLQLPLLCHSSWAFGSMLELIRKIREKKPDVILSCSLTNSYLLAILAKILHVPFIYMVYEPYHTLVPQKWLRPIARSEERLTIRTAERVFIFTPQMKQYCSEMGANPDRIDLFKSGVGKEIFDAGLNCDNRRAELGINPNEWVIFFMGWLYDFSGMRQIFQSIADSPSLLDGARLLVVGDGDIYTELKNLIDENNLGSKIIMTGKRPYCDIPTLLATANVCLMPALENDTTRDIVPMKVYEYLAAKRPLVATGLPGMLKEFGTDSGILYTKDPLSALQQALSLAKKPWEVLSRSEAGRKFAEQNADWEETTDKFEAILSSVMRS